MIALQCRKRNFAALVLLLIFVCAFISMILSLTSTIPLRGLEWIFFALQIPGLFFVFKLFYHWAKAKGYSGALCMLALTGVIGIIVLGMLPDRTISTDERARRRRQLSEEVANF